MDISILLECQRQLATLRAQLDDLSNRLNVLHDRGHYRDSFYASLLDQLGETVWVVDDQYRLLYANAAFHETMRQFTSHRFVTGTSVFYPGMDADHRVQWQQLYDRALGGEELYFEILEPSESGAQVRCCSLKPLRDGDQIGGVIVVSRMRTPTAASGCQLVTTARLGRAITELLPGFVWIFDLIQWRMVYANRSLASLLGYPPSEAAFLDQNACLTLLHPEDHLQVGQCIDEIRSAADDQVIERVYRLRHRDGSWRWFRNQVRVFQRDAAGQAVMVLGCTEDVTDAVAQNEQLRYHADLLAHVPDAVIATDLAFRIQSWNVAAERIYGWSAREVLGRPIDEVLSTRFFHDSVESALQVLFSTGRWTGEVEQRRRDGSFVPIQSSVSLLRNQFGQPTGIVALNRDISERRHAERLLQSVNIRLEQALAEAQRHTTEVMQINKMHDLLQVCQNRTEAAEVIGAHLERIFPEYGGYLAVRIPGINDLEVVCQWGGESPEQSVFPIEACWALRRGQMHLVSNESSLRCRHLGRSRAARLCCLPLVVQGQIYGVLHIAGNETPRNELLLAVGDTIKLALSNLELRELLREQAVLDPLTGLFNRRYLETTLPREAVRARREKSALCVVMLDIDHFKAFNDRYGHEAGDMLLREVGWIFRDHMQQGDIACRYGGEEFVLVLPGTELHSAVERIEQIRLLVGQLRITYHGQRLDPVSLSAGIAAYRGGSVDELMRAADTALYAAKRDGRNRIVAAETSEG